MFHPLHYIQAHWPWYSDSSEIGGLLHSEVLLRNTVFSISPGKNYLMFRFGSHHLLNKFTTKFILNYAVYLLNGFYPQKMRLRIHYETPYIGVSFYLFPHFIEKLCKIGFNNCCFCPFGVPSIMVGRKSSWWTENLALFVSNLDWSSSYLYYLQTAIRPFSGSSSSFKLSIFFYL